MSTLRTTTSSNLATLALTANTGDTYYETSNNRIVTWNGTTWTYYDNDGSIAPFANSYSVTLDGVDDQITGPADCLGFTGTSWSYCFWARWGTLSSTYFNAFLSSNAAGNTSVRVHQDYIRIYTYGNVNTLYYPTGGVQTDKWYFIAVVQDGTSHSHYVKSSTDDNVGTPTGSSYRAPGTVTMIGKGTSYVDELASFNQALSSSDVTAIYNSGSPADLSSYSLGSWWRMGDSDSGTGTSVSNEVSGGDSLTLTNGAAFSTTLPS